MSRKLSDRFTLRRVGDLEDVIVIEHGPVSWIDCPRSHLPDLYRLIRRELSGRDEGED